MADGTRYRCLPERRGFLLVLSLLCFLLCVFDVLTFDESGGKDMQKLRPAGDYKNEPDGNPDIQEYVCKAGNQPDEHQGQ